MIAVAASAGGEPELVLAYSAWNVLLGYSPETSLRKTAVEAAAPASRCNLTGGWNYHPRSYDYQFEEAADGSFVATSTAGSWRKASVAMGRKVIKCGSQSKHAQIYCSTYDYSCFQARSD